MGMTSDQLDYLDRMALRVLEGDDRGVGPLSTGERIYVAIASGRPDLLPRDYGIPDGLWRLGAEDTMAMMERWKYGRAEPPSLNPPGPA